jgi:integrase
MRNWGLLSWKETLTNRKFSYTLSGYAASYYRQRRNLALKLQNPKISQITFHTFRHWKATMEYHRTKDILYVMKLLGHKNIKKHFDLHSTATIQRR